jgi:pimeloyl-ACP methyl ester carboxylesterase
VAQVEAIARAVRGPCDVLILPGCGHAPHLERPEETLGALVRLIDRASTA